MPLSKNPINQPLFNRFTSLLSVAILVSLLATTSHAEDKLQIESTDSPDTKNVNLPNSGQNMTIRFNKDKDAPAPKVNIRFKDGYKKTDISERPKSTYKRSLFVEIPADTSEQEQIALISERCKRYSQDQKPYYFINLLDQKTKNPIKTLSCEEVDQQNSK